ADVATFSYECADKSIAEVTIAGSVYSVKGLKEGSTTLTVKCGTESQTVVVTVRKGAQSNGWL
ncbi:MAG: hypothetical protein II289_00680, partial [Bacteroidales bacterium]|nr:hypothetical protein [Bacteroidales bacterium]